MSDTDFTYLPIIKQTILPFTASQIRKGLNACQILGPCRTIMGDTITDKELNNMNDEALDIIQRAMMYETEDSYDADVLEDLRPIREEIKKQIIKVEETLSKYNYAKSEAVTIKHPRCDQEILNKIDQNYLANIRSNWINQINRL